ncbi:Ig-like domain-containing protein [Pelomonas sp. P7]|uniref:Ig-like domain-containing protein n=1 Tax=Pelomonas caseinilytica TaxID=2906763 RepID=A0ABS8XCP4_9BURK|nr:Ig-like domain-containing protein [Pelomonas sp. P7]MCE4536757.1 Ig-like domain-containing protein [Pelomonas sp. P7]
MQTSNARLVRRFALLALPAALAACGGGSSDSAPAPSTPVSTTLTLKGTAATGAAMANAAVKVSCATGTATATAGANGSFTVSITNGALPCVLTATSSDGATELHSVAAGTGQAETTANITPLSELLVARLAGTDPKSFVASFTATTPISTADVTTAQTALLQTLTAAGVDTTTVGDIVGGALTAGSGTGYDGVLDKLKATVTSAGTTLADLTAAVASTSKLGSATGTSTIGTVLAPAVPDCSGMKSGTLRVVDFSNGSSSLVQVDAVALTATLGGTKYTLTKTAACGYKLNDAAATRVLVSRSGIAVLLQGSGLSGNVLVAVPEQKLDVAAVAGSYDRVQYNQAAFDATVGEFGDTEFAADGQNGVSMNCPQGYGACVKDTQSKGKLVANANGGFDYVENGVSQARVFGFRNASGRMLLIGAEADGTFIALASKDKLALPAVDKATAYWQFTVNTAGLSAITEDSNTVTAVDTAANTATRKFASDSHTDTVSFNTPFDGTRYRAASGCKSSTGGAFNCNGVVQLPFGGFVMTVSSVPTKHFLTVSIDK